MRFDSSRYIFSLAGALLAGDWSPGAIRETLGRPVSGYVFKAGTLGRRVWAAFPQRPEYGELVAFLRADRALGRVLAMRVAGGVRRAAGGSGMGLMPRGMGAVEVPPVETVAELAAFLGLRVPRLEWMADLSGRNRQHGAGPLRLYRYRWVPRRRGMARLLEIPKRRLKELHRILLREILEVVPVHGAAHGFYAGRSIVTNAVPHCGQRVVLRFDLADFFPSVTAARVVGIFRTLGYPVAVARMLAGLCTTRMPANVWEARPGARDGSRDGADFEARQRLITRHLPQGAPTSPALANLAAGRLDRRLAGLAAAAGAAYTRYADDLAFSGGDALAAGRERMAALVAVIVAEEGFRVNHRKTRVMRAGVRQQVTGLVVNVRPNVTRNAYDRLKAVLTNCLRHGPAGQNREGVADFRAHLAGRIGHLKSVHAQRGDKLRAIFERIVWGE